MTIGEYLRGNDIDTYRRLQKLCRRKVDKPKKNIELGDKPERLMRHNSYRREGRRISQVNWG